MNINELLEIGNMSEDEEKLEEFWSKIYDLEPFKHLNERIENLEDALAELRGHFYDHSHFGNDLVKKISK